MSAVAFVDPALIDRIVAYLESRQSGDGSWLIGTCRLEHEWLFHDDKIV